MELSEHVKDHVNQSIQTSIIIADNLSEIITQAGKKLVSNILSGKKILSCGSGSAAALSNYFSTQLLHRFSMERPALPAISLSSDGTTLTSIASDQGYRYAFSQQINALGKEKDILLCISNSKNSDSIFEAIRAAHEKNMYIISLTGKNNGRMKAMYKPNDLEIQVPSEQVSCIHEGQLMVINCFCKAIDHGLFGL